MKSMTTKERYDDICRISGMSEEVVRRVLAAEKESIMNSLKRGERATLIGRCIIRPEIRTKIAVGGQVQKYVKLSADVSPSLKNTLGEVGSFQRQDEDISEEENLNGIRLKQISALV